MAYSGGLANRTRRIRLGLLLVFLAAPFTFLIADASHALPITAIAPFSIPTLDAGPSAPLTFEFFTGEFTEILSYLLFLLVLILYYISYSVVILGILLVFRDLTGFVVAGGVPTALAALQAALESSSSLLTNRSVQVGLVGGAILVLILITPGINLLAVELLLVFVVWGLGFLILAPITLNVYARGSPFSVPVILYPLVAITLIGPLAIALLASPSLGPAFRILSTYIAFVLLETVFAVGGLNTLIRRSLQLQGPAYGLFWLGLAGAIGLLVSIASTLRDRL